MKLILLVAVYTVHSIRKQGYVLDTMQCLYMWNSVIKTCAKMLWKSNPGGVLKVLRILAWTKPAGTSSVFLLCSSYSNTQATNGLYSTVYKYQYVHCTLYSSTDPLVLLVGTDVMTKLMTYLFHYAVYIHFRDCQFKIF